MKRKGLTYYQAETDRFQDIKIKRLKKQYGCEGYAVYTYLQNEIYRVEGCFMRFGEDDAFDCADYWNIDEKRIYEIIDFCADINLFDAIIWRTRRILTSREIQENYAEICRRAKKQIIIPKEIALTEDQRIQPAAPEPLPLFQEEQPETITGTPRYGKPQTLSPQSSAEFRGIPQKPAEKCTKEKKIKINPPSIPPQNGGKLEEATSMLASRYGQSTKNTPDQTTGNVRRNPTGLLENLQQLRIPQKDIETLLVMCRYGEIGHPIWQLLDEIRRSRGKITMPARFLMARLKAS